MDFRDLVSVEWSGKLILLTSQLAEFYGCESRNISDNFKRNENRFVEGKHYFKLEGETLKQFRHYFDESGLQKLCSTKCGLQISPMTRCLYLWTVRGAARHAKMLNTDKAWDVFELLEDNYFNRSAKPVPVKKPRRPILLAFVYVLLMSDGTVKIGQSGRLRTRVSEIKRQNKLTVEDIYITPLMSRKDARLIEWLCQEKFSSRRIDGEFFSVEFDEACAAVDVFVKVATVSLHSKHIVTIKKLIVDKKSI